MAFLRSFGPGALSGSLTTCLFSSTFLQFGAGSFFNSELSSSPVRFLTLDPFNIRYYFTNVDRTVIANVRSPAKYWFGEVPCISHKSLPSLNPCRLPFMAARNALSPSLLKN